jgi:hypothetical protein
VQTDHFIDISTAKLNIPVQNVDVQTSDINACTSAKEKNVQVKSGDFTNKFIDVFDTDRKLRSLTGITNLKLLATLVTLLEMLKPVGKNSKLSTAEKIVLTFLKLKLNLPFRVLGILFDISPTSVKNIFHESIHIIEKCLQSVVYWPSKEEEMCNMLKSFIENGFANVRVILLLLLFYFPYEYSHYNDIHMRMLCSGTKYHTHN